MRDRSAIVLAAAALVLCAGCSPAKNDTNPVDATGKASPAGDARKAAAIDVVPATAGTGASELGAAAVLQLDETLTARVGSIVDAVVVEITVKVGDRVSRGAVLGTLHSHRVHEALADYRKALADRRHHETELGYATDAEARAERLLATKAVSQQDVNRARADRVAAAEALSVAESEIERARGELEHLGLDPGEAGSRAAGAERIPIRAPVAGVVLERLVTPGTAVTPGTPLFVVSDLSQLWAVAEVDQVHLPRLAAGQDATLHVAAYPDQAFHGRVLAIGDTVDESTRRVSVRVAVPNRDGRLKPQMYATVQLGVGQEQPVVVVPSAALQTMGGETVVFVERPDGEFERRTVVVAAERGDRAELRDGVRAGERVATTGSFLLKSAGAPATPE